MANEFIPRRVAVGLGKESTPGTEVAAQTFLRQMKFTGSRKTTTVDNTSALGVIEGTDDSAVVAKWFEGVFEGPVQDTDLGYLLAALGMSVVSTDNPDTNPIVKDHTFNVPLSNTPPTYTIAVKDPVVDRRYGLALLDYVELSVERGGWLMVSAGFKAKPGVTATDTVAYVTQNLFTSKHLSVKLATNVAGLSGATAIDLKSFKLRLDWPSELYIPLGTDTPTKNINSGGDSFKATFEMVLQYNATTYEDLWFANTIQAMSATAKNTDVTIGASANPGAVFTAPKVRLTSFDKTDGLNDVTEQTVGGVCQYSAADGYMIRPVLTNTNAGY